MAIGKRGPNPHMSVNIDDEGSGTMKMAARSEDEAVRLVQQHLGWNKQISDESKRKYGPDFEGESI